MTDDQRLDVNLEEPGKQEITGDQIKGRNFNKQIVKRA